MVSHFDSGDFSLTVQIEFDKDIAADKLQSDLGKCYKHTGEK